MGGSSAQYTVPRLQLRAAPPSPRALTLVQQRRHQQVATNGHILLQPQVGGALVNHSGLVIGELRGRHNGAVAGRRLEQVQKSQRSLKCRSFGRLWIMRAWSSEHCLQGQKRKWSGCRRGAGNAMANGLQTSGLSPGRRTACCFRLDARTPGASRQRLAWTLSPAATQPCRGCSRQHKRGTET